MYLSSVSTSFAVRLSGVDSSKFLQGQLTCDVTRLDDGQWTWAAACSPKGRVIDVFKLFRRRTDDYLLLCWSEEASARLLKHLAKYKVFFKCELTPQPAMLCLGVLSTHPDIRAALDLSAAWQVVGSHNQIAQDIKQASRRRLSQCMTEEQLTWAELIVIGSGDDGDSRALETLEGLRRRLSASRETDYLWQAGMVALGIPRLDAENSERFTAHALGLHSLGAISFSKGCFTGQEIVARTQYLGSAKKYPVGLAVVDADLREQTGFDVNRSFTDSEQLDAFLSGKAAQVLERCHLPPTAAPVSAPTTAAGVRTLLAPFREICLAVLDPEKI